MADLPFALEHYAAETDQLKRKREEYQARIEELSGPERQLVEYLQILMEIRDRRKNFFAKSLTVICRIAERMFTEAGVGRELIPYYTIRELLRGEAYLRSVARDLASRPQGFQEFIPYDGEVRLLSRPIDGALETMEHYYNEGILPEQDGVLSGQSGFRGVARGRVRIVLDVNRAHGFQGSIGHRHDETGIRTAHETGDRYRHERGWHHVSRRHRLARAEKTLHHRDQGRHAGAS